jgi:hypothetical protein
VFIRVQLLSIIGFIRDFSRAFADKSLPWFPRMFHPYKE